MEGYQGTTQIELLEKAKKALKKAEELAAEKSRLESEKKKLEKAQAGAEKDRDSDIKSSVKKGRDSLDSEHSKKISELESNLKKVENKRAKAKEESVKDRINRENLDLIQENKNLKSDIRRVFFEKNVPFFCNTYLFCAIFHPTCLSEWVGGVLIGLFCVIGIPAILIISLEIHDLWKILLIVGIFVVVSIVIYIAGTKLIEERSMEHIKWAAEIRRKIRRNKIEMKKTAKLIRKDRNESIYGLEDFDLEIGKLENEIDQAKKAKQNALDEFDHATSKVITDEVTEKWRGKIEQAAKDLEANADSLKAAAAAVAEQSSKISSEFGPLLGADNMTIPKIEAIQKVLSEGNATSITDAVEFAKSNKLI
ncbi:MAG: hypothetical protein J5825_03915 [Lachnospiraceae bacterium]|nr:hypothetical protein [Lachnospiraceae bacterium]